MSELIALAEVAVEGAADPRAVGMRDGRTVERVEFLARVGAWQAAFAARPGTRWALLQDDAIEFAAALYGAWHAGKQIILPADAQPATLERLAALCDGMAGELPGGLQPDTARPALAAPRPSLDAQATSLVLFTSGSGGEPSAIRKSLGQLQAEISAQHALHGQPWAALPDLSVWTTVSHQHIYGLLFVVLWPLAAGCRIAMPRLAYAEQMAERIGPQPALLVSSPAHLKRLPQTLDWSRTRGTLRALLSSGGPLPPEAALSAEAVLGVSPIEIYGSSETGGVAWRQRAHHGDRWIALPGVEWRIEDDAAEPLLSVRSPFLPDDQWWRTADRVRPAEDGTFTLQGRADRIVKIEERRVSLSAIERVLAASPLVAEVRTLALAQGRGLRVAAVVVPSGEGVALAQGDDSRPLITALRQLLHGQVDRIAWPRHWRFPKALPANSQGKVTEAALVALFTQPLPWRWTERGEARAVGERMLEPRLTAFEGHFPDAAILPGVVQIAWVVETAREVLGLHAPVRRVEALKFQQVVRPGTRLRLTLQWDAVRRKLQFRYESGAGTHGSGRLCYPAEPAEPAEHADGTTHV
jgi:acyl-CoA synthetase (AMP-forming)/AMP-acid ligase II